MKILFILFTIIATSVFSDSEDRSQLSAPELNEIKKSYDRDMFQLEIEIKKSRMKKYRDYLSKLEKMKIEQKKEKNTELLKIIDSEIKRIKSFGSYRAETAQERKQDQEDAYKILKGKKTFFVGTWKLEDNDSAFVIQANSTAYFTDSKDRIFKWAILGKNKLFVNSPEKRESHYFIKIIDENNLLMRLGNLKARSWQRVK